MARRPGIMPPVDQHGKASIRRSLAWSVLSYIPVVAGIAWFIFAWHQWPGPGPLLAVSGLMVGLAGSSALFLPLLRQLAPTQRVFGMSVSAYSYVSIGAAIAIAMVLAVVAFLIPLK
jgi:hypothetical protein